ncbi:MAG: glycosyltransferase family 10 [Bacteriovoracia bacterium]
MNQTQVSVVTAYESSRENRMFKQNSLVGSHAGNAHWLEPLQFLYQKGLEQSIKFDTSDVVPIQKADIVLFFDFPLPFKEIESLRRQSKAAFILLIVESPLNRSYVFDPRNHVLFDAIVTYNDKLVDGRRYFSYKLPLSHPKINQNNEVSYNARRVASLISTNRDMSLRMRLRYLKKAIRAGWKYSIYQVLEDLAFSKELYSERRKIADTFVSLGYENDLDVFGQYWDEHPCSRGVLNENKLYLLQKYRFNFCYENCLNDVGYISEKIFDALYSNTVPIYLGNTSISKFVPSECFVDAKEFKSAYDLVRFTKEASEATWKKYILAGDTFLKGSKLTPFLPEAYTKNILEVIRRFHRQSNEANVRESAHV